MQLLPSSEYVLPRPFIAQNLCSQCYLSCAYPGEYVLGDLGSACHLGQPAHEHTLTHWPAESACVTSAAIDFCQLAVTLLDRAGKYELTRSPSFAKCQESIDQLTNEELKLKSFVSGLLQTLL